MKRIMIAGAVASVVATSSAADATTLPPTPSMIGIEVTGIPSAVTVPAIGIGAAVLIGEAICKADKDHSCTKGLKQAGQDLVDYARGKKNAFKAIGRLGQRVFGW